MPRIITSALAWILVGIGWGLVIGAALEAAFGAGGVNLVHALEGAALAGVAGALVGAVVLGVGMTLLHGVTLVPLFVLMGKLGGVFPPGQEGLGILHERSARSGALVSVILGVAIGMTFGAMCGAGITLQELYGAGGPTPALHWGTALGALVGGIAGLFEIGRTAWHALPDSCQRQFRTPSSRPANNPLQQFHF